MDFEFRQAHQSEREVVFSLLKGAAQSLQSKNIDQWTFWNNPPKEKIEWIEEGFTNHEFYFITHSEEIIGMFRLLNQDLLYWGEEEKNAKYIHSLVIKDEYSGNQIGKKVVERICHNAVNQGIFILRLDCNAANDKLCKYYENQEFVLVRQKRMPHSLNNLYQKNLKPVYETK